MVYMRTFHGRRLDYLAEEVRRTYVRFPNTTKIVFDQRGLGDAFPQFLNEPWTDPASGKEYPAWICDNEGSIQINALPILRSVKATQQINQAMASALRVSLEQKTLLMPVNSRNIVANRVIEDPDGVDTEANIEIDGKSGVEIEMSMFEKAIFAETDALQIEMGNIIGKTSAGGNYLFETAKSTQRKDRYSALSMGVHYVHEMEEAIKKKNRRRSGGVYIGYVGPVATQGRW